MNLLDCDMFTSMNKFINRYELTEINGFYFDANVDLVFVHGVNEHSEYTWTSEEQQDLFDKLGELRNELAKAISGVF